MAQKKKVLAFEKHFEVLKNHLLNPFLAGMQFPAPHHPPLSGLRSSILCFHQHSPALRSATEQVRKGRGFSCASQQGFCACHSIHLSISLVLITVTPGSSEKGLPEMEGRCLNHKSFRTKDQAVLKILIFSEGQNVT